MEYILSAIALITIAIGFFILLAFPNLLNDADRINREAKELAETYARYIGR